jgi:hypothetical protein
MWRWYSAASSVESRTVTPVSAVFTAFKEDLRFPSSVRGPVLRRELARLAARRSDMGVLSPDKENGPRQEEPVASLPERSM